MQKFAGTACYKRHGKNGGLWSTFSSLAVVKHLPTRYAMMFENMRSTAFGIQEASTGSWILRLDNPHFRHEYHHLNLNPKTTGMANSHAPLPSGLVQSSGIATKAINVVGKGALVAAVAVDAYR
jgi:hypothetical protein